MTTKSAAIIPAEQESAPPVAGASHIRRAFKALEVLIGGPQSASSIAVSLGVNRSTALRLMTEIEALGYVYRNPETKTFSLVAARFHPFISSQAEHLDWSTVIDPILSGLRDEFGESAVMGVPANGTMVYLAFFPSFHQIMVRERLGTARPMHCSALGKAYLSALDERALDSELGVLNYQGGTAVAARGPIELRERLVETRRCGYAVDRGETAEGAACVAVPVRIGGTLIGAFGLSGLSSRLTEARIGQIGERLREIAKHLPGSPR